MPLRTAFAALCLSSLVTLTAPAAPTNDAPFEHVRLRAADDLPPSCPLCGGSNFADFKILTRAQKQAAIVVALTI